LKPKKLNQTQTGKNQTGKNRAKLEKPSQTEKINFCSKITEPKLVGLN
jgi:hypothetical protein